MSDPVLKRVEDSLTPLVLDLPFFATLAMRLKLVPDDSVPTFCTDGVHMRFNPEFVQTLTGRQLVAVDAHEASHLALGHLWRLTPELFPDDDLRQQAADYEVDAMLEDVNSQARRRNLPPPFPPPPNGWLFDEAFKDMASEKIYQVLRKRKMEGGGRSGDEREAGGSGDSQQPQGQGGQNQSTQNPPNQQTGGQGQGTGQPPGQPRTSSGEFESPPQAERAALQHEWEQAILQACAVARGSLPGAMQRVVDKLTRAIVDWRQIIREFCRRGYEDYSFARPNLRYAESGFFLPSLRSERPARMVWGIDTSGSIPDELAGEFLGQAQLVLDEFRPEEIELICCDARNQSQVTYRPGDEISRNARGGGGTNFRPVFEAAEKDPPVCLIYLTDLEGTFPDKAPDYPVLWVVWGGNRERPPFGEVVYAEE
jgi:predicted metal-dependent peptidase